MAIQSLYTISNAHQAVQAATGVTQATKAAAVVAKVAKATVDMDLSAEQLSALQGSFGETVTAENLVAVMNGFFVDQGLAMVAVNEAGKIEIKEAIQLGDAEKGEVAQDVAKAAAGDDTAAAKTVKGEDLLKELKIATAPAGFDVTAQVSRADAVAKLSGVNGLDAKAIEAAFD